MNTCVALAIEYFGSKVGQLYSSKFDGEETKIATKAMIEHLRSSFRELINQATWMDHGKNIFFLKNNCMAVTVLSHQNTILCYYRNKI